MKCKSCGCNNPIDARFCRKCGTLIVSNRLLNKRIASAIIIGIIGIIFILFSISAARDISPYRDGVFLNLFYFIVSCMIYPILDKIKKRIGIKTSNFCFSILCALFVINTFLLPIWNGSLVSSYLILSIGLEINMIYAWIKK